MKPFWTEKKVKKLRREYTVVLREKLLQMYKGNARENEFLVQGSSYWESTVHVQCTCIPPALCHLSPFEIGFLHVYKHVHIYGKYYTSTSIES